MNRRQYTAGWGLLISLLVLAIAPANHDTSSAPPTTTFGNWALAFEENIGQVAAPARFVAHGAGGNLYFTPESVVFAPAAPHSSDRVGAGFAARLAAPPADVPTVQLRFLDASPGTTLTSSEALPGQVNYLVGSDPARWRTGLPTFAHLTYQDLYPGIDLTYSGSGRVLKGTYTVAPGADPARIRWRYACGAPDTACNVTIDAAGNLQIRAADGTVFTEQAPVAWQEAGGGQAAVSVHYTLDDGGNVGFAVGVYDPTRPLVIDPTLIYFTILAGNDGTSVYALTIDTTGNAYLAGTTRATIFPLVNPVQPTFGGGGWDAFVAKLNPQGTALVYSTYLGGNGDDQALGIAVDAAGQATVVGGTNSANFPTYNAIQGQFAGGYADAFVTRLNPRGNGLIYSTYLGGSDNDMAWAVALDSAGAVYLTGHTWSAADFPLVNPLQPQFGGGVSDGFVAKLNPTGAALLYSTFLGGNGGSSGLYGESGLGIAVDPAGNATVIGKTDSANFPLVNPVQATYGGGPYDAFVTRLNAAGSVLLYSTFLGGGGTDEGQSVALDRAGNAYLAGWTQSPDFPVVNPLQPQYGGNGDAFVAKLAPSGSALVYATFLGGSNAEPGAGLRAIGVADDAAGNVYVAGSTASPDFPLVDPIRSQFEGASEAFVSKINTAGSALVYSTFLGGPGADYAWTVAVDNARNAYVGGMNDYGFRRAPGATRPDWAYFGVVARIQDLPVTTPTPTVTGTPPTGTPTPTGTPPCSSPMMATGAAVCQWPGLSYAYTFTVTNGYSQSVRTFGEVDLEIGPGPSGPWTITRTHGLPLVTYAPGSYTFGNSFYLTQPLPSGIWHRIRLSLTEGYNCWTLDQPSPAQPACNLLTPSPSPTSTPTVTRTPANTPTPPPTHTATASATRTPGAGLTPTSPPTQPVGTTTTPAPSATATPCTITFADVDPTNPFYPFIRCLACRQIVSGYADGTFRWGNDVTRGQLAKIVANAAGLADPIPSQQQTFADVPPSDPFWLWIERLFRHGAISGYVCGGPPPQNKPCFRPTNAASRGQIAKIVALAGQIGDPIPTTRRTFADVPLSNPFWGWIEQLAGRGVISGYACGGPGEPCDPQGRPYFRWGANTTRGQLAKIAAQTFYPNCQTPAQR